MTMIVTGLMPNQAPGFTFAGHHSGEYNVWLARSNFHLMPPTRDRFASLVGRPGDLDLGFDYDARSISLECVIHAESEQELRQRAREVASWLDPRAGAQQLILDSEPDKYYMARCSGTSEVEIVARQGRFTVPFRASDPFAYAVQAKQIEWEAPYGGQTSLQNDGTADCPLVITLVAPASASTAFEATGLGATNLGAAGGAPQTAGVTLTIGGISVTYTGTIGPGDTVIIDTGNFTVTKNGANALQYWQGDFPVLRPGANMVTETDTAGAGVSVTFQYRERWL